MLDLICKICGYKGETKQGFNSHIVHKHHITSKDYYDEYFKKENEDICPSCGKPTKFRNMWYGYNKHCCNKCIPLDPEIQNKMKATCQEKYGTDYAWQAEQTKEKIKVTTREHYGVDCYLQTKECRKIVAKNSASEEIKNKIKQTNLERYGVTCSWQAEKVKEQIKQTKLEKYGSETYNNVEKAKETSLSIYGVDNPAKSKQIQDKIKQICLEKYGVDNIWKDRESRIRAKSKSQKSMNKNGNNSSLENYLEDLFIANHIDYKPQYSLDPRYPFHCDFYLPEKDIFVEINGFWTHQDHWFDENNENDLALLKSWKENAKIHSMYEAAIRVWTNSDVDKRQCAKNNNLNYVVLWNLEDIKNWIDSNFEVRHDY